MSKHLPRNFHPTSGHFTAHNIKLENHELETINFLLNHGENIEVIVASHTPKSTSPDIFMRGITWEIKSPTIDTSNSISHLFYRALTQSINIIFDLRRLKSTDQKAYKQLMKLSTGSRRLCQILIIRKNGNLEEYRKK